ncbi:HEAT repeat domain-containing protein [Bradymonas sediminis]|nr:hypothetical protein [Bradymonas sediminis]TDP62920.1 HEAT repeat protein [Bradymonas sediminis]
MTQLAPNIRMKARLWAGGARRCLVVCCLLILCIGALSCDPKTFGEAERREVDTVLSTGIGFSSDPYVQAETLRVLEIIGNPALNHHAEALVESSPSPMVRVAALRVLLANDYKDIRRVAVRSFNEAKSPEKMAILEAVSEYGSAQLRRVLTGRALNSSDPKLRRVAFEQGPLSRLRQAQAQKKTTYLQNTLFPEIGQFIDDSDPVLGAMALRALVEAGEEERAQPMLAALSDPKAPRAKRLAAAEILGRARVAAASDSFQAIVDSTQIGSTGLLVVPERIDKALVRAATLGLVANGNTDLLVQAQSYLENASVAEAIEVLEALSANPSEDAAITLKIAMQDARPEVRDVAVDFYAGHKFAEASAFMEIMAQSDFATRRLLAEELATHYPKQWAKDLAAKLGEKEGRLETLALLRDVVDNDAQNKVLEHLLEPLSALAGAGEEKENALAALLLLRVKDDAQTRALVAAVEEPATHYAYLEHLVRSAPRENVEYFRENLHYGDLYVVRLMSAAGMLLAFEAGAAQKDEPAEGAPGLPVAAE